MKIEGAHLCLVYDRNSDEETFALKDVAIALNDQGVTGLTGPSGSGKSSLLYLLSGLRRPTSGTLFYDNRDTDSYTQEEIENLRRQKFGFIFQRPYLINYLNVLDNVMVGCVKKNRESEKKALDLLDRLNLSQQAYRRPHRLSVGQKQKIAVIRALMNDPEVIFADEPTASLDQQSAMEVISVLKMNRQKTAVLIVTHDKSILQSTDFQIELRNGSRIVSRA